MSTEPTAEETKTHRMDTPVCPASPRSEDRTHRTDAPAVPRHPQPQDKTHRMDAAVTPQPVPQHDATHRMDASAASSAALSGQVRAQNDVPTRHAAAASPPRPGGWTAVQGGPLGFLEPGTVLCGNCVVVRTHHNHESSRPGLFECQAPEGRVMVKVAATEYPPEPELWRKLAELKHRHVLRIFRVSEEEGRFYEVQEFCSGGTLASYVPVPGSDRPAPPPDWIERILVPAFRLGISYLHAQGIVHRDIKPSNMYLREENGQKTLVIGDFDISSILQTGRTSRSTDRAAGTWIYSAPEAFPRFIDEGASQLGSAVVRSSDFYSFGVVIVELLLGTTSLHQARLPDLYDFYLQGGRAEVPAGLPPRLTELLSGLLCRNRNRRWGSDEVARWLAGQTSPEDRQRIADDRGYQLGRSAPPFNSFDSIKPTSLAELAQAMVQEPKTAIDEIMSGDVLLNWIGQIDARIARLIRQDRATHAANPALVLLRARLHIDPAAPLPQDRQGRIHSAEDWVRWAEMAVANRVVKAADVCQKQSLLELETWLQLKQNPEKEPAGRLAAIVALHEDRACQSQGSHLANPRLLLESIFWAFSPSRPFLVAPGVEVNTPLEIAKAALGEAADWKQGPPPSYLAAHRRWQEGFLEAYLRERLTDAGGIASPLLAQIDEARRDFARKTFVAFEVVLRLLDPEQELPLIELDPRALEPLHEIPYGEQRTLVIPFRTQGTGMPYAAIQLQSQWPGVQLETHEVNERRGQIVVQLHSQGDIPVGREYAATLSLAGNTARLATGQAAIRYKVTHPVIDTLYKLAIGATIGAVIMGGFRAALLPAIPGSLALIDTALVVRPQGSYIFWGACALSFLVFRIWLWALANHAR